MLQTILSCLASTGSHTLPIPKSPTTSRPGQTSSPPSPLFWKSCRSACHNLTSLKSTHHGQNVKVGMRTGSPEVLPKLLALGRMVVEQSKHGLRVTDSRINCAGCESVRRQTQSIGEAGHHLCRQSDLSPAQLEQAGDSLLHLRHELFCPLAEPWQVVLRRPQALHSSEL